MGGDTNTGDTEIIRRRKPNMPSIATMDLEGATVPLVDQGNEPRAAESNERPRGFTAGGAFIAFSDSNKAQWLCLLSLLIYMASAVLAFSWLFEKWSVIDSLYFAVVTFTTVGYGDLSPTTPGGRLFCIVFVLVGIVILGVVLGILGEKLVAANEAAVAMTHEKSKQRILQLVASNEDAANAEERNQRQRYERLKRQQTNLERDLQDVQAQITRLEETYGSTLETAAPAAATGTAAAPSANKRTLLGDCLALMVKEFPLLLLIAIFCMIMGHFESWNIVNTLYFAVITTTTVGYGDFSPGTPGMRIFAIFVLPFGVAVLTQILGRIASLYMDRQADQAERAFLRRELTLADLQKMDATHNGRVSLGEFQAFLLVAMQKVDPEDMQLVQQAFSQLDADGSGFLHKSDLVLLAERNRESQQGTEER